MLSPEDLVRKCAESTSGEVWGEFILRFHSLICCVVLRVARAYGVSQKDQIDDLVQEIYLKLAADDRKLLRNFRPDRPDAAYAFIKVVTANAVRDHFRTSLSLKRGGRQVNTSLDESGGVAPQSTEGAKEVERQVLLRETEEIVDRLYPGKENERNRMVFWLYYRQGFTIKSLASLRDLGLTESGIESMIYRMTSAVRSALVAPGSAQKWFSPDSSL